MDIKQFKRLAEEGKYEEAKKLAESDQALFSANPKIEDAPKTIALNEFINAVRLGLPCTGSVQKVIKAYHVPWFKKL